MACKQHQQLSESLWILWSNKIPRVECKVIPNGENQWSSVSYPEFKLTDLSKISG